VINSLSHRVLAFSKVVTEYSYYSYCCFGMLPRRSCWTSERAARKKKLFSKWMGEKNPGLFFCLPKFDMARVHLVRQNNSIWIWESLLVFFPIEYISFFVLIALSRSFLSCSNAVFSFWPAQTFSFLLLLFLAHCVFFLFLLCEVVDLMKCMSFLNRPILLQLRL